MDSLRNHVQPWQVEFARDGLRVRAVGQLQIFGESSVEIAMKASSRLTGEAKEECSTLRLMAA